MLRFITCDDKEETLDRLAQSVRRIMMPYDYDYNISRFTGYTEEFEKIVKESKEQKIYILDIEMPGISGLEIASEIRESGDWESIIIFVTVHPECKDDIFYSRILALDFISKYYNYESRLEQSLIKALEIFNVKNLLIFNFEHVTYRVPVNKILYIEKLQNEKKCIIVTESGEKFSVICNLKSIIPRLGVGFYQTHKACIVNTNKIYQVDYIDNLITFNNNEQTNLLSERKKKGLKNYVGNY